MKDIKGMNNFCNSAGRHTVASFCAIDTRTCKRPEIIIYTTPEHRYAVMVGTKVEHLSNNEKDCFDYCVRQKYLDADTYATLHKCSDSKPTEHSKPVKIQKAAACLRNVEKC